MRLIIHGGTHKTGTTSIQTVLAANVQWLRERGLHYPDPKPFTNTRQHHRFAHGLTGVDPAQLERSLAFCRHIEDTTGSEEAAIISAEPLYRHIDGYDGYHYGSFDDYWERRVAYLQRLRSAFGDRDADFILFFRDPDAFRRSYVWDLNRTGYWTGDEEDFQRDLGQLLEYDKQKAAVLSVFPSARFIDYERALTDGGSVQELFRQIGFPLPPEHDVWERQSPPANG